MQWIKEVELVDSVDDLRSSSSIRSIPMPDFEVLDARIASALNRNIHNSHFKEASVCKSEKPKKRTVSFAEDRSLAWSTRTSGSLEPTIPSRTMPTFSLLKRRYSGIRFDVGRNFIIDDKDSTWRHLGGIVQTENTRIWENQDRIGIVWPGDSSEESRTWLSQIEDNGEKKYRARKWKLWEERHGQESGNKTACTKNSWRLLAIGNQRAMCERRQLQFPSRYYRREKWHSRICLRILSCSRVKEKHREPEVSEEKVPAVECHDGLARITLEELAITHSVRNGTLQNACTTRPRVVVGLGKNAHMHTVRLMNSLVKGPKRMMTKEQ